HWKSRFARRTLGNPTRSVVRYSGAGGTGIGGGSISPRSGGDGAQPALTIPGRKSGPVMDRTAALWTPPPRGIGPLRVVLPESSAARGAGVSILTQRGGHLAGTQEPTRWTARTWPIGTGRGYGASSEGGDGRQRDVRARQTPAPQGSESGTGR